jgi:ATP dependent DNA ligase domain
MVLRSSRGRPLNAPAAFIHPCQPIVAKQPPSGPDWAHELKHDGYRLQIHVRDGRVRLYTINGADWSKRYPRIDESAARIGGATILDAEVVWMGSDGVPDFDVLHSRVNDRNAVAIAFDRLRSTVRIFDANRIRNARRCCAKSSGKPAAAFSTLNMLRVTAINCLLPPASLALRALSPRSWMLRISRDHRKRG